MSQVKRSEMVYSKSHFDVVLISREFIDDQPRVVDKDINVIVDILHLGSESLNGLLFREIKRKSLDEVFISLYALLLLIQNGC